MNVDAGPLSAAFDEAVGTLARDRFVERIWEGDHTLWQDDPTEVADRLGWLHSPREMLDRTGELSSFAAALAGNGVSHALVMGMGGSSLFPEVVARTFGDATGALDLHVLDTTDPGAIRRIEDTLPLDHTLFVAASKSGTTVETRCHLDYFWERVGRPERFTVVTDPGSALAAFARDKSFQAVFENRPDIGGRYSALSHFGLVPAALAGVHLEELLHRARVMADLLREQEASNPGVRLGALLGVAALHGRDKATIRLEPEIATFGAWLEQLLAESTGKHGTGIVPVLRPGEGDDRVHVSLGPAPPAGSPGAHAELDDPYDLGGQVLLWEFATAVAGRVLGVNPFDQPDVEAAKQATARALEQGTPPVEPTPVHALLDTVGPGDYLAVQAYVDPGAPEAAALEETAYALGAKLGVAATFGVGPRYLHSTGQLHKGGAPNGVFLQVVGEDPDDVTIPGRPFTFSELKRAQAAGDLEALRARGRRAARVSLDDLMGAG